MKVIVALTVLILILTQPGISLANPSWGFIVNNTTMECADFLLGDECEECFPPAGWQTLGPEAYACPEGFVRVSVKGSCISSQDKFCCTGGIFGAKGNCTMLIKNDRTQECTFADNLSSTLPDYWQRKPENISAHDWFCPYEYVWTDDAKAWIDKGLVLDMHGKYDDAVTCYDKAIQISPQDTTAWVNKGTSLCAQGKFAEAIKAYDKAIQINPQDTAAWHNKGLALKLLGRTTEANAAYAKAKELGYTG